MRLFHYERPDSLPAALRLGSETDCGPVDARTQYLAGGTTLIDLMKLDVLRPDRVVDLKAMRGAQPVQIMRDRARLSAFASMAEVADHAVIRTRLPVIAQSLDQAASAQLRNMATLGGNVLQKTRCPYYRDTSWASCNKRIPGSGCTAMTSPNRNHAVLGTDDTCIAQYPGDLAIALVALDAQIRIFGRRGYRREAFSSLHRPPQGRPHVETTLEPGDLIADFEIPMAPWMARSAYLKVRDRTSYEFALSSVAIALDLSEGIVREVRIGLGGMAYRPWRARAAETRLVGQPLTTSNAEDAARIALAGAVTHGDNAYKPELARRAIVQALMQVKALAPPKDVPA